MVGIVAAVLVIICGAGVACTALVANEVDKQTSTDVNTSPTGNGGGGGGTNPTPSKANEDDTFDLAPGTTINASDSDGSWTIKLSNPVWKKNACNSLGGKPDNGYYLVVDIEFTVKTGTASINPFFFEFHDVNGIGGGFDVFNGCDKPSLSSGNDIPAGGKRTGKLAFDATGKTGTVEYSSAFSVAASWKIPAA